MDKVGAISHLGSARPVCDFPSAGPDPPIPSLRTNLTLVLLVKGTGFGCDADSISSCLLGQSLMISVMTTQCLLRRDLR